jgi:diacylglycerol kinase (ATP)
VRIDAVATVKPNGTGRRFKRLFILNKRAGGAKQAARLEHLKRIFRSDFELRVPGSRDETIAMTRSALLEGYQQIIPLGGDGTLNAVVNGFFDGDRAINPQASFCVTRWGTGSDYFRTYRRLCGRDDWEEWIESGSAMRVDVGCARFGTRPDSRYYFANVASSGISGLIARDKEDGPDWMPAGAAYLLPTLSRLVTYRAIVATIRLPEDQFDVELMALIAAKGLYSGGGMRWGNDASLTSGLLEVTVIPRLPVLDVVTQIPKIYTGGVADVRGVRRHATEWVEISAHRPVATECDGENSGEDVNVRFEVLPGAIRVTSPASLE